MFVGPGMHMCTYGRVGSLLLLVALLVGGSLGVVGRLLLLAQALPLLAEKLADLTCDRSAYHTHANEEHNIPNLMPGLSSRTLSRWSLAKNMYAESGLLGALGSFAAFPRFAGFSLSAAALRVCKMAYC